jgi:hypothetical protein
MVGLMVIVELLNESKKFAYDKNFLTELLLQKSSTSVQNFRDDKGQNGILVRENEESGVFRDNQGATLTDNILEFESSVLDCLLYLLEKKEYRASNCLYEK